MDILLISPPLSVEERYGNRKVGKYSGGHLPPLGIAYIAGFLRNSGFSTQIIDSSAYNLTDNDILQKINDFKPKVIGLSAITPTFNRATKLATIIKNNFPDILLVIGGHHASILPVETLQESPSFDLLVYGEGEITSLELLKSYKECGFNRDALLSNEGALNNIAGIAFRKSAKIVVTPSRMPISNLDILPYPAWDLLPMDKYIPLPNQYFNKPVVHMVATRGCAFQCSFCSNNAVFGRRLHALSPKRLTEAIKYVKSNLGAREISFWDDSMTTDNAWLMEFCRLMVEEKMDTSWTCYSRVDTVTKELLNLMKKAGCWNIFYGFESGNQSLLDLIDKKINLEQIRQTNRWTKEAGIEVRASFMLALPGETPEMAEETINFAICLEPDYAQFSITTPFPKTKLYEDAKKYGILLKDYSKYNMWEVVFVPSGYRDAQEVKEMERRAFKRFYLRLNYFLGRIKKIRSASDILRYIKGLLFVIGFIFRKNEK